MPHLTPTSADESRPSEKIGRRLLPQIVDELAQHPPGRHFASISLSADAVDGWRDVSFKELSNAVNYAAWWMNVAVGTTADFETIAYLGANDIRYTVLLLAATKTGHKVSGLDSTVTRCKPADVWCGSSSRLCETRQQGSSTC